MTTQKAQRIILFAGLMTFAIGALNSITKNHTLPSRRFLVGNGVVYLALTGLAEGEPDIANALALAVLTTSVLGEGGGVLDRITPKGELDTSGKDHPPTATEVKRQERPYSDESYLPGAVRVSPAGGYGNVGRGFIIAGVSPN